MQLETEQNVPQQDLTPSPPRPGLLFVLSAPSGTGKDSVINALKAQGMDFYVVASVTTRLPRPGESEGNPYHFVSQEQFNKLVETDELLEYANAQLLEFRHYDNLLTKVLQVVYASLLRGSGFFSRWRMAREAERLNTIRLEVIELTERTDNSIKFLSDMFSARLYKLCAQKVGVPDYKDLVQEKLHTAEDLYRFMVEQFNQSRAFVLELMVVIILVIELVYFFKGKM